MPTDLIRLCARDGDALLAEVQEALRDGADPRQRSEYCETPLNIASANARFDVVRVLLRAGADETELKWNSLFRAIAFGRVADVTRALRDEPDLGARDHRARTPWLLSVQTGDIDKVHCLLDAGSDPLARAWHGQPALHVAIRRDQDCVLRWLLSYGFDMEDRDDSGNTALLEAVSRGAVRCAGVLIDAGANLNATNNYSGRVIEEAEHPDIVAMLLAAGAPPNDVTPDARAELTGLAQIDPPEVSHVEYLRARDPRFGRENPTPAQEPYWDYMMCTRESAFAARERFESESERREARAVWCYHRFGMSFTPLGDGRYVEIAGEHEDYYDPDFCIFNEVFLHEGQGRVRTFLYPREVFPPTDFHSATLAGKEIWIIGNLGYIEDRRPGTTPVYVLNLDSFAIRRADTRGECPGWISKHHATLRTPTEILVTGGNVVTVENGRSQYRAAAGSYVLDLTTMAWARRE